MTYARMDVRIPCVKIMITYYSAAAPGGSTRVINDPPGQWFSLDFEKLGRTDTCVKIVITTRRDCGRPLGSIHKIFIFCILLLFESMENFPMLSIKWSTISISHIFLHGIILHIEPFMKTFSFTAISRILYNFDRTKARALCFFHSSKNYKSRARQPPPGISRVKWILMLYEMSDKQGSENKVY